MDPYLGEIRMFANSYRDFAPKGWAACDGQVLPISQNTALFSLLVDTYGGNGKWTFALPDMRDCVPVGAGAGPGLPERYLGEKGQFAGTAPTRRGAPDDVSVLPVLPGLPFVFCIALEGVFPPRS